MECGLTGFNFVFVVALCGDLSRYGRGVLTGFRVRDRYCFNTLLVFKEIMRNGGYGAVENDCSCLCGWLR